MLIKLNGVATVVGTRVYHIHDLAVNTIAYTEGIPNPHLFE